MHIGISIDIIVIDVQKEYLEYVYSSKNIVCLVTNVVLRTRNENGVLFQNHQGDISRQWEALTDKTFTIIIYVLFKQMPTQAFSLHCIKFTRSWIRVGEGVSGV